MEEEISIAEARRNISAVVSHVGGGHVVRLTRHGRAVAVMMSPADYDQLTRAKSSTWARLNEFRQSGELITEVDELFDGRQHNHGRRAPEL